MTTTVNKERSRSRGRSPHTRRRHPRNESEDVEKGSAERSDSGREEPKKMKAERRARPERPNEPLNPPAKKDEVDDDEEKPPAEGATVGAKPANDEDEQQCPVCKGHIRGGRVGMKMHVETSTKHRQWVIWNRGGIDWNEAWSRAKKELKKEWKDKQVRPQPAVIRLTEADRRDGRDRARSKEPRERSPRRRSKAPGPDRHEPERRERRSRDKSKAPDHREHDNDRRERREPARREDKPEADRNRQRERRGPATEPSRPADEDGKKKAVAAGSAERTGSSADKAVAKTTTNESGDSGYSYTYDESSEESGEDDVVVVPTVDAAAAAAAKPKAGAAAKAVKPPDAAPAVKKSSTSTASSQGTLIAMADFYQAQSKFFRSMGEK